MIITYEEFCELITSHVKNGKDFYVELIENVIDNPSRYCGLFRLSNAKTKLIQNVTQSKEIKFGDIIEELTTEYLDRLGYINYNKNIDNSTNKTKFNLDQFFTDEKNIYLVEMKIRDDHDSTKKISQYDNFYEKIKIIHNKFRDKKIYAIMWFVDDNFKKNKKYYQSKIDNFNIKNVKVNLYYGSEFFYNLNNGKLAWCEFIEILEKYRIENSHLDIEIPDFGTSTEILEALVNIDNKYWLKLMSDKPIYKLLRSELFSKGDNLFKAKNKRN